MTLAPDSAELRTQLVASLIERGVLRDPAWQTAFQMVPREVFVPKFARRERDGQWVHYDSSIEEQAGRFLPAVYSDSSLVTQFGDAGVATSSSTQPSLMAIMLELLDVHDGHTVLEIGTGTGYNAALLSHRLGNRAVTSIDVDPDIVSAAQHALSRTPYRPAIVCGDGFQGVPNRAPFDRVVATCGVPRVPLAWIAQTRAGGKVLTNTSLGLVRLTVSDGGHAHGNFDVEPAAFMLLRHTPTQHTTTIAALLARATEEGTSLSTHIPSEIDHPTVEFLTGLVFPEIQRTTLPTTPPTHAIFDPQTNSWAKVHENGHQATVVEHGPRSLWKEIQTIINEWNELGQPAVNEYALTVGPDGTHHLTYPKTGWTRTI